MNKKSIERQFIVYDKKRKGFIVSLDISEQYLNSTTKDFKNAKRFWDYEACENEIKKFYNRARSLYEEIELKKKVVHVYNRIPNYQHDDFQILVCDTTVEVKPNSLIRKRFFGEN